MKNFILQVLEGARGDDLYRSKAAFKNLTLKEMNEKYGKSGKTRNQIIQGYQEWEDKIDQAKKWLKEV